VKPLPVRVEKWSNDIRYVLGFTAPDVFNIVDLRMGEQWWTARWRAPDGRTGTVPLNEPDGARGPYHTSDSLYFGNSIRWRRGTIGADLEAVNVEGTQPRMLIDLVLRYHRRRHGGSEAWRYDVRFFRTRAADVTVDPPERYDVMSAGGFTTEIEP
jgi:hypothetical protein